MGFLEFYRASQVLNDIQRARVDQDRIPRRVLRNILISIVSHSII